MDKRERMIECFREMLKRLENMDVQVAVDPHGRWMDLMTGPLIRIYKGEDGYWYEERMRIDYSSKRINGTLEEFYGQK